jgi:glycine/D-amino acid oxidase-like deaminating enzyme
MPTVVDARPQRELRTDVLVVGGGAAGVAAAVTCARQGLEVLVHERYGFSGGGAVAGLSGTVCGLYLASDRATRPEQVVHGFAGEFVRLLESRDGVTGPVRYGKTFTRVHDPLVWREAADHLLREAGVRVLLHATVTDVLLDGGERVEGVVAYTKQGKLRVDADLVIDASGDADLVAMAGLPFTVGQDGRVQNPTMIFRLQNVDVARFLGAHGPDSILDDSITAAIRNANGRDGYVLPRAKVFLFPTPRANELLCNATRVVGRDGRELNPLIAEDLAEAEVEGRAQVRHYARFFREHLTGCQASYVNDTGPQVGVRQSRQVKGGYTLRNDDVTHGAKFDSGIARSPWPIELHTGEKPRLHWLTDDYYEIPYQCFVPHIGEGLLTACRCLSAQHEAMASARVTAQCFSYGHAIGHAAVIAVRERMAPRQIAGRDLREVLNRDGARLGPSPRGVTVVAGEPVDTQ